MVLRLQKSAPNSCGLLSGFHSVSLCSLLQVSIVVSSVLCFRWKKPPPCHLPAAATPHARRAHPPAKNFVFASGPPSYRPGEVRGASSLELRPVVPLPSLAQTHMFFSSCLFWLFPSIFRGLLVLWVLRVFRSLLNSVFPSSFRAAASVYFINILMLLSSNTMRLFFGSRLRLMLSAQRQNLSFRSSSNSAPLR